MKAVKIKQPFGLNENKILVHIADVESGKKCYCFCPSCQSPLIAAKGSKNQHHFKHAVVNKCEGGLESAIHLGAKKLIMDRKKITLPKHVCTASMTDSRGKKHTEHAIYLPEVKSISFDSVQEERELYGMKADILAMRGNSQLLIEIYFRHKVDDQKIEKIKNANISAIEINLSELTPEDVKDSEAFWSYMNDPKHVQWLYNAKAHESVYPVLLKRLAVKIQEVEKEYDSLNEQVKAMLVQDFKIVKMLRSKKHRPQSIYELKRNPAWQIHGEGSHLSLEKLPNFLNLYVPDGDWIFGCDRRIWQAVIYNSFICNNNRKPFFFVWEVAAHIGNYGNIPRCVQSLQQLCRCHPELVPSDVLDNMPSLGETVRAYCNHLCGLGILELSGDESFKIISKTPGVSQYK